MMPEESYFHRPATAFLFVCVAVLVAVKCSLIFFEDYFVYTTWADRALTRAQNLMQEFQAYGAEYSARHGARTPGGALYYYLYFLIGLNESPIFVYAISAILHFASAILIFAIGRNIHSRLAGMIAALAYLSSFAVNDVAWQMWNPLFGLPFGVAAFFFFYRVLCGRSPINFIASIGLLSLAAQMHISYFALMFAFLVIAVVSMKSMRWQPYLGAAALATFIYTPWIVSVFTGVPGDGLPTQFFPGFVGKETAIEPLGQVHVPKYELGISIWVERLFRIGVEALSFAETNHVRIDLPIVTIAGGGLLVVVLSTGKPAPVVETVDLRRHALILTAIVLICSLTVYLIGTLTHGLGAKLEINRYLVHASPAAALLSGIAIAGLWQHADRTRFHVLIRLVALAALLGVVAKGAFLVYEDAKIYATDGKYRSALMQFTNGSGILHRDKAALFAHLRAKYGDRVDIGNRVASVVFKRKWKFLVTPSEYMLGRAGGAFGEDGLEGCFFVFWRDGTLNSWAVGEDNLQEALTALQGEGLAIGRAVWRGRVLGTTATPSYFLVHYALDTDGCAKTFDNPYVLSPAETVVEGILQNRDIRLREEEAPSGDIRRFFVKHNVPGTKYPLNLLVELRMTAPGKITASVVSKQLSSSYAILGGYWEPFFINAPAVVLRDKASARTLTLPIFDGLLGAFAASTPWRSRPLDVPPGTYEVRLSAETVGRVWGLTDQAGLWDFGSRPQMNVLLTDSYRVLAQF